MAGELSLKTPLTGLVTLVPTNTATDKTITLPATTGTMVVQDTSNITSVTNLAYTGTLTGGTGVINIGSGQVYKDASGNVGVGVTPSAWGSGWAPIQFSGDVSVSRAGIARNTYYDGSNYRYIATAAATLLAQSSGTFQWFNAPSGTAGNVVGFTQAMTLDTSGNLNLSAGNVQLPAGKSYTKVFADGVAEYILNATSQTGWTPYITYTPSVGTVNRGYAFGAWNNGGTQTEWMRLFDGNLLVGTTTYADNAKAIISFTGGSSASRGLVMVSGSTASTAMIAFKNPNGYAQGEILTSGSTTSYNTSSDYRLKENVTPMQNALAAVAQLKPCTYTWKTDGSAGQGFIAHELQAVVPDCVTGEKDAVDKDGNPEYQGVDTSFLVATLVSAIQELTARLEVLENK